jgi:hypothetical protein
MRIAFVSPSSWRVRSVSFSSSRPPPSMSDSNVEWPRDAGRQGCRQEFLPCGTTDGTPGLGSGRKPGRDSALVRRRRVPLWGKLPRGPRARDPFTEITRSRFQISGSRHLEPRSHYTKHFSKSIWATRRPPHWLGSWSHLAFFPTLIYKYTTVYDYLQVNRYNKGTFTAWAFALSQVNAQAKIIAG